MFECFHFKSGIIAASIRAQGLISLNGSNTVAQKNFCQSDCLMVKLLNNKFPCSHSKCPWLSKSKASFTHKYFRTSDKVQPLMSKRVTSEVTVSPAETDFHRCEQLSQNHLCRFTCADTDQSESRTANKAGLWAAPVLGRRCDPACALYPASLCLGFFENWLCTAWEIALKMFFS